MINYTNLCSSISFTHVKLRCKESGPLLTECRRALAAGDILPIKDNYLGMTPENPPCKLELKSLLSLSLIQPLGLSSPSREMIHVVNWLNLSELPQCVSL